MDFRIENAGQLGESMRARVSEIFVEGFYQWLHFFSKDKQKLAAAFQHMFQYDFFYVALADGEIAGIAACTDGKKPCVRLRGKELRRHLGLVRGLIAEIFLKGEFEHHLYPFALAEGTGSVEFVATAPEYRGQGVASAIIAHFFGFPQFREYVLEVADTNTGAVKLYEKLGFREFTRVKMKNPKQSGVNHLVYMKCAKETK